MKDRKSGSLDRSEGEAGANRTGAARVLITRRLHFSAAHRLGREDWSEAKNREVFGLCSNPNWHGHNYEIDVSVEGPIDRETGYVLDLKALRDLVEERVIRDLDHRNLNVDVGWLQGVNPTTENLVVAIWNRLAAARLQNVDLLVLEANHDLEMLRRGPYPWVLKQRVASRHGHLSNAQAAEALPELVSDRLRAVVNVCTRLRFCTADGAMEFREKRGRHHAPPGFRAWYAHENRRSADHLVVCGHWSTLDLALEPNLLMLDSGCLWGGTLTAYRLDDGRMFQVGSRHPLAPKPSE